mgnify:CR=1 FL=1
MKNFRMPLRFYSWCSTRGAHGNLAQSCPAHVARAESRSTFRPRRQPPLPLHLSQHPDLSRIPLQFIRCLQIDRYPLLFRMIQLSENAKRLSEEYKQERKRIPWNAIYGFRNRIVHDYGNVDLNIVFETLKNDIPELLEMIKG